jgi:hypothetical protein
MSRVNQLQRRAAAGIGALALLAGVIACGSSASPPGQPARQPATAASQPGPSAWQPATIDNLVLEGEPGPLTTGTGYHPIDTRAEDPAPLTTAELAKVFSTRKGSDPMELSQDCAGAVTGAPVIQALKAAGCSQVLRLISTSTGTGGPYATQVDIFNLAGGPSLVQAARAFGQEPLYGTTKFDPSHPPDAAPGGFIRPWPATSGVARAAGNAADVDAFGHFLAVLWTYSVTDVSPDGGNAENLTNMGTELELGQFADNRASAG